MAEPKRDFATEERIQSAETELGVTFPAELKAIWRVHNCNELPGGWRFFPVFDPSNPRKTAGAVTYENLRGAWGKRIRALGLIALASNGTGNHLVARVVEGSVEPLVLHWHHETERLTPWKPGLASVLKAARKSADAIDRLRARFAPGKA